MNRVDFSPDGRLLVTASRDHFAVIWDVATRRETKVLRGHLAGLNDARWSADGRWIVTGSGKVGMWSANDVGLPRSFLAFLRGHDGPVTALSFAPSGWRVATASRDGTVRTWDCTLCGRLPQLTEHANELLKRIG